MQHYSCVGSNTADHDSTAAVTVMKSGDEIHRRHHLSTVAEAALAYDDADAICRRLCKVANTAEDWRLRADVTRSVSL